MPSVNTTRTLAWFALSPPSLVKSFSETISNPRSMRVLYITRRGICFIFLIRSCLLKESLLVKLFTTPARLSNVTMPTRVVFQLILSSFRNVGRNFRSRPRKYFLRMLSERSINKARSIPASQGSKSVYKKEREAKRVLLQLLLVKARTRFFRWGFLIFYWLLDTLCVSR